MLGCRQNSSFCFVRRVSWENLFYGKRCSPARRRMVLSRKSPVRIHANTHPVAGSQDLSDAEQSAVVSSILRNTRGVEVFDVIEPSEAYGSDTGLLHVWLDIDIVRLGRDTPESVFAFLHASTSADS